MRRFIAAVALLCTTACLDTGLSPSGVSSIQVNSNASPNGVFVGDQVQLNAEALDLSGNVVAVAPTYSSSNTSVATVTTTGLITALAAGTSSIAISAGGQTASLTLSVDGNISSSIQVMPVNPTLAIGSGTTPFTATVLTTLNNPARNKTVTWSTADATKVTVDQSGNVTPVAAAAGVQICATASDNSAVKGCSTVVVH